MRASGRPRRAKGSSPCALAVASAVGHEPGGGFAASASAEARREPPAVSSACSVHLALADAADFCLAQYAAKPL